MANGAAGCGWEFRKGEGPTNSINWLCGFLSVQNMDKPDQSFSCNKYHTELNTQRITGHPFRCEACCKAVVGSFKRIP